MQNNRDEQYLYSSYKREGLGDGDQHRHHDAAATAAPNAGGEEPSMISLESMMKAMMASMAKKDMQTISTERQSRIGGVQLS